MACSTAQKVWSVTVVLTMGPKKVTPSLRWKASPKESQAKSTWYPHSMLMPSKAVRRDRLRSSYVPSAFPGKCYREAMTWRPIPSAASTGRRISLTKLPAKFTVETRSTQPEKIIREVHLSAVERLFETPWQPISARPAPARQRYRQRDRRHLRYRPSSGSDCL